MSEEIQTQELPFVGEDTTVIATNQEEMGQAQHQLIHTAQVRIDEFTKTCSDLEKNLEVARKNRLKQSTIISALGVARRKLTFYEKLKAAFEAGFVMIPNMPMQVFAVRTDRRNPPSKIHTQNNWVPAVDDIQTSSPVLGDGEYVSPTPIVRGDSYQDGLQQDGKTPKIVKRRWASAFDDVIDFPFALARPQIVDLTTRAMALKVFDEIGVLPAREKNNDPMVIGTIVRKNGWRAQRASFLICWFIETKEI